MIHPRLSSVPDDRRCSVQVSAGAPLPVDVAVDLCSSLFGDPQPGSKPTRGNAVIARPQRDVHVGVRQAEEKLVLALLEAISVRGRRRCTNLFWQSQVAGESVDLALVEMCQRLEVSCPIPILDEKALV